MATVIVLSLATGVVIGEEGVREALDAAAALLNRGQPKAALAALEAVKQAEPGNPWLAYYTAAAHLQRGEPYLAIEHAHRAAKSLRDTAARDDRLVDRIQALHDRARRSVLRVSLRLGAAYDSNVTFLDDRVFTADLITGEEDGLFESKLAVALAPIKTRSDTLTLGADSSDTTHFLVDSFDLRRHGGFIRYTRRLSETSEVAAEYDWAVIDLDHRPYLTRNALDLAWRHTWPAADRAVRPVDTTVSYGVEKQDFHYRVERMLRQDGLSHSIGVTQRLTYRPAPSIPWECTARVGYTFATFDTDGREYDRYSHRGFVEVELPLKNPSNWDRYLLMANRPSWLTFEFEWEDAHYDRSSILDPNGPHRRDRTTTYGVMLSQVLSRDSRHDLVGHLLAKWMDAESNVRTQDGVRPFAFEKFVIGVQLEWSW